MNIIKKILGIVWIGLGLYVGYLSLTVLGIPKFLSPKPEDVIFGSIILFVLTPIIVGSLLIFGWFSLSGDYKTVE